MKKHFDFNRINIEGLKEAEPIVFEDIAEIKVDVPEVVADIGEDIINGIIDFEDIDIGLLSDIKIEPIE